jgi:1,2-diacylglycerol 3-alpha-glucosyltransferase
LKRAAVIFHRFGPYHWARVRAAAKGFEILAIEEAAESAEYRWDEIVQLDAPNLQKISLLQKDERPRKPAFEIARRLQSVLEREEPDAVFIPGWSDPAALGALRWGLKSKTPVIIMSETTKADADRSWSTEWVKKRIVGLCSAALVGGTPQLEYMEQLGMPSDRIFTGYDAVDNDYFARKVDEVRGHRSQVRDQFGLPENYFLASARFIPKKNLPGLIQAYAKYRRSEVGAKSQEIQSPWHLVVLGDGPLKADLCHLIADLGLSGSVHLPGFKQYGELPVYYALARAFVHASLREPWGLVVNEAMASGLPVIVSKQCGCSYDLVLEGKNGFQFDANDSHALAALLGRIASMPSATLSSMGVNGKKIVDAWSTENFGKQFELAVKAASKSIPRRWNLLDEFLFRILIGRSNSTAAKLLARPRSSKAE